MRKKITLLLLTIAVLLASVSSVWAYALLRTHGTTGEIIKWKDPSPKVHFYINMSGHSVHSSVSHNDSINEMLNAMATWSTVPTASFKFIYAGESNYGYGLDGINNISWMNMGNIGVVAFNALSAVYETGEAMETDIVFNSFYPYHINGASSALDLQNVAAHELGHSVPLADLHGLEHLEKTMLGVIGWGETKKRDLHQDDIDGITFLYPAIAQPECTYSLSPSSKSFDAAGGNDSITVQYFTGCPSWSVTNTPGWITITNSTQNPNGMGAVSYTVAGNSSTSQRAATMNIAGKPFTVTQSGQVPAGMAVSVKSLKFSDTKVLTSKVKSFTVTNKSSAAISVSLTKAGNNARDFTPAIASKSLAPGASATVAVTFRPRSVGGKNATLKITSSNTSLPAVFIPLTGKGI